MPALTLCSVEEASQMSHGPARACKSRRPKATASLNEARSPRFTAGWQTGSGTCRNAREVRRWPEARLPTLRGHAVRRNRTAQRTFNFTRLVLVPKRDPPPREIIRRHFHRHAIAGQYTNAIAAHVARQRREHLVSARHGHTKRGTRQHFRDGSFELDRVLLPHG